MAAPAAAPAALKRTPLYDLHRSLGAKLIDFGGWEMPVQYAGILEEHRAVREAVGLFDVSHMGELAVSGPGALAVVQRLTCNDVGKLADGRIQYSAFLTEKGTFVDDLLVYRQAADAYPARRECLEHAEGLRLGAGRRVGRVARRGSQRPLRPDRRAGPEGERPDVAPVRARPSDLPYYGFRDTSVCGAGALVSRTGYTGEDGFEIYCPPESAERIFRKLLEEGRPEGAVPCGLGARDTLRLEAKMALYGNDIDDTVTAWEADLGWIVKMGKGDFIGREALAAQKAGRASPAASSGSRWSTAASPAMGIPRRPRPATAS